MPRPVYQRTASAAVTIALLLGAGIGMSACGRTETTASLLADARQYQLKGDNKAALIQLKNAVTKSPADGTARLALATFYSNAGDAVSAEKEIRKAISLGIGADEALPILGKSLSAQSQFQKVLDEITPAAASKSAPLLALRGNAHLALKDAPKAKADYEQALALQANSGDALIGLVMHSLLVNDAAAASRYSADAIAKDPSNAEVWMVSGMLSRKNGKNEEALAAYEQALKVAPAHRTAHTEKAYLEIGLGKFDAAKADLDAARKVSPGNLMVTYVQGLLDYSQGKYLPALESVQKVLRAAPDHLPSILLAGAVELRTGATQQAEQHLRKYLETYPKDAYARKLLAQALLKSSQPADAAAMLAPLLNEPSLDPQLLALAGQSYMQARDFGKAAAYFQQASALAPQTAALHTSLGLSKLGQGDAVSAISELERGAALDPSSASAGIALVQTELRLKHYDKALAAVQTLEKQQPADPQVHNLKGAVYLGKADFASARASFEKAVALQPTFIPAVANLARLDMRDKQPDAAQKRFEAVLDKDKKNIPALTSLAELALVQGHPEQATAWLEKSVSENPDAIAPTVTLGAHYLRTRQEQKGLTLVRKAQTAHPANPDLLDLLGQAQIANQDQAGALETYSKLVNIIPKSAPAQMRLASVHVAMKNNSLATQDLARAVALDPHYMPARVAQVELAARKGNGDQALALVREIQKLDNKAAGGYLMEGELQLSLKKPALALPPYEKAFSIAHTPQILIKIAEVMKQTGKDPEARLLQWQKDNPGDLIIPMYVAESYLAKKQFKSAAERFEAILKSAPNNALVLNNLAWAYQEQNDPRALETAERALKAAPQSPAVMDTLGWMLVGQGDTARGLPLLQKAVALAPAALEIRYHLAFALNKTGDKKTARTELETLLRDNKPFPQIEEAKALLKVL